MKPEGVRMGVTMRVLEASGYQEPRDGLAQAWSAFLQTALPEAAWLPIPNLGGPQAVRYCQDWGINRLILTGGEDIGVYPTRDETERALLAWAAARDMPVLGICRGMQLMSLCAGGVLAPVQGHVGARHVLHGVLGGEVNSFHTCAPVECPIGYEVLARAEDGGLEAMRHMKLKWEGWMWHPERELQADARDVARLRSLFV